MTTWKSVTGNSNLVQHQTDRAILIKLPKSELKFWHPAKLVRFSGKNGYLMKISFTDEFKFKAFRNGKGRYNRFDKIEEVEMSPTEIEKAFGCDTE